MLMRIHYLIYGSENNLKLDVLSTEEITHSAEMGISIFARLFKLPISYIVRYKLHILFIEAFIMIINTNGMNIDINITEVVTIDFVSIYSESDGSETRKDIGSESRV